MGSLTDLQRWANTPDDRQSLDVLELFALVAVIGLAALGTSALALAQLDEFTTSRSLILTLVLTGLVVGAAVAVGGRPHIHVDKKSVLGLAAIALVAAVFFVPGFPYAFGDKDPGVYVIHGFGIERTGSVDVPDEAATVAFNDERATLGEFGTGGRYPGLRIEEQGGDVVTTSSDFFHFVPSTFAVAIGIAGTAGVFNVTPVIAILGVLLLALAVNRALGPGTALVTATLLTTNVMQVWQAKTPSTEIPMQAMVTGALLCAVLAVSTRWAGASFLAGVLVGTSFLVRPDGFLVVALGIALVAITIVVAGADRRVVAGVTGAAVTLPYALYNAYALEANYVRVNGVPPIEILLAFSLLALGGGVALRWLILRESGGRIVDDLRRRLDGRVLGGVIIGCLAIGGIVSWNRQAWFGRTFGEFAGRPTPTYNERNLHWMSYFITRPGLILVVCGVAVLAFSKHWNPKAWILLGPGLLLLPIYIYEAKISARLMWWVRRFIPVVVPALMVTLAVVVVFLLTRRSRAVVAVGVLTCAALLLEFVTTSLPIRTHREFAGSYSLAEDISEATAGAGIVLVTGGGGIVGSTRNLPSVSWMIAGTPSTYLPNDVSEYDTFVSGWDAATDGPVFLFSEDLESLPEGLDPLDWEPDLTIERQFPLWHETSGQRPRFTTPASQHVALWRYLPSM